MFTKLRLRLSVLTNLLFFSLFFEYIQNIYFLAPKMTKQDNKKKKTTVFPVSRLKKIMQANENVGKISASVPVVASRAVELFLKEFVENCVEEMKSKQGKRITNDHLHTVIKNNPKFKFMENMEAFKNV
ncbi:Dr1-associated corepressor [Nosema granulosis]|uniref:Dr1-associated corepressor n=1 Tax=Nosema granulosis TaxID=83296 RepID=A0A9P6GZD0_9MICR|nr:Dr1-associated corepressor [Nosema granulosis]